MTNRNLPVTCLTINKKGKYITSGVCMVNKVSVYFNYDHTEDKMMSTSLLHSDAAMFGLTSKNWMYLICGSIAHAIKQL